MVETEKVTTVQTITLEVVVEALRCRAQIIPDLLQPMSEHYPAGTVLLFLSRVLLHSTVVVALVVVIVVLLTQTPQVVVKAEAEVQEVPVSQGQLTLVAVVGRELLEAQAVPVVQELSL